MSDSMTSETKMEPLTTAIRIACEFEEGRHLRCSYPDCNCKKFPRAVKAAIEAYTRAAPDAEAARREAIADAVRAAQDAASAFLTNRDTYVMMGPGGLALTIIGAIRALASHPAPEEK